MPVIPKKPFQTALVEWFKKSTKDYPWRKTTDPWLILISEIMLQQTQVTTVLNKGFYTKFTKKYPTPAHLAKAPEQQILSDWEGLGYYRRVRNLQKAAQAITTEHNATFPTDHTQILALPGIGQYTAGAVASFAYNQPQPIVDANIARVLARLHNYQERIDTTTGQKQLWKWASELLSHEHPRAYNSAIMELGQTHCSNKNPDCPNCPVQKFCKAKNPAELPIKKNPKKAELVDEHCILTINSKQQILLTKQPDTARRAGMHTLPERPHHTLENLPLLSKTIYGITHHRVTLHIYQAPNTPNQKQKNETYHPLTELQNLPIPSPFRKALNNILPDLF